MVADFRTSLSRIFKRQSRAQEFERSGYIDNVNFIEWRLGYLTFISKADIAETDADFSQSVPTLPFKYACAAYEGDEAGISLHIHQDFINFPSGHPDNAALAYFGHAIFSRSAATREKTEFQSPGAG